MITIVRVRAIKLASNNRDGLTTLVVLLHPLVCLSPHTEWGIHKEKNLHTHQRVSVISLMYPPPHTEQQRSLSRGILEQESELIMKRVQKKGASQIND